MKARKVQPHLATAPGLLSSQRNSRSKRAKGLHLVVFIVLAPIALWIYAQMQFWQLHSVAVDERCKDIGPCVCFPWKQSTSEGDSQHFTTSLSDSTHGSNPDEWWIHHVDWDLAGENDEGYCFQPIRDSERVAFLRSVYQLQWRGNCSEGLQSHQINNGFGASVATQTEFMTKAMQRKRPYQMTKHWRGMHWLYVPKENTSWAWCESTDLNCYILPISSCLPVYGHHDHFPSREHIKNHTHELWITWYMSRLQHHVRYQVYTALRDKFPPLTLPCTVMHVRRSDAGLGQRPFRRYAALSEYIDTGNVKPGETVVLLTDDHSTIVEAQTYHRDIQWKYVHRPRQNGTSGGTNGHIPSNDPAFDTLMILCELQYASRCTKLVYGGSTFVRQIQQALQHNGVQYTKHYVNTSVSLESARKYKGKERGKAMLDVIKESYEEKSKK